MKFAATLIVLAPFLACVNAWSCYCNSGSSDTAFCGSGWPSPVNVASKPPPLHYYGFTKAETTLFKSCCTRQGTSGYCY
ncbi:hypothetical protein BDZ94DRAFT_1274652 [Collybia nuda]|uniref:Secreted protein n=1 Tax=Collybia nuda TaxID=64659 RepID=A0A9P5XU27_9AGAR|nr:hypothetical protein BDZ94DRAFT_1274652 [Collybia nuda]